MFCRRTNMHAVCRIKLGTSKRKWTQTSDVFRGICSCRWDSQNKSLIRKIQRKSYNKLIELASSLEPSERQLTMGQLPKHWIWRHGKPRRNHQSYCMRHRRCPRRLCTLRPQPRKSRSAVLSSGTCKCADLSTTIAGLPCRTCRLLTSTQYMPRPFDPHTSRRVSLLRVHRLRLLTQRCRRLKTHPSSLSSLLTLLQKTHRMVSTKRQMLLFWS